MAGDLEKQIIAAGYRQLAKKAHPDHHGTAEEMIALNAARDRLIECVDDFIGACGVPEGTTHHDYPFSPYAPANPPSNLAELYQMLHKSDPTVGLILDVIEGVLKKKAKRGRRKGVRR